MFTCVAFFLSWGLPAWSQVFEGVLSDPDLSVRLYAGFSEANPMFRPNLWVPISVEIENVSQRIVEGRLIIQPHRDLKEEGQIGIEVPIAFAPRQKKLIRLVGRIPEWTEDLVATILPRSRQPVAAVGIREMAAKERLVAVLADPTATYGKLEKGPKGEDSSSGSITVERLSRSDVLPEVVQGYDTLSLLVWDGLRPEDPTPDQIAALRDYLELGGTLVLALGDRADRLNLPGWKDFLGPIPTGSTPLPVRGALQEGAIGSGRRALFACVDWPSGVSGAGVDSASAEKAIVAAVGAFDGEPCLNLDGVPILFRKPVGAGRILVSRISFSDWLELGNRGCVFWQDLVESLPLHPPALAPELGPFSTYVRDSLLGELPSPWFIGGFLGLYTVLAIPVNYFVFRKRKRLEMAWLVLPVLALFFSWLAYHIGALQQQGGVVKREIAVGFQPYGSSKARAQTLAAVYSPKRQVFEISLDDPCALPVPTFVESFDAVDKSFTYDYLPMDQTGRFRPLVPRLLVHHWAAENLAFDTICDLGGAILVQATETEQGGFLVDVDNRSRFDLADLSLVFLSNRCELGAVPRGTTRRFDVATGSFVSLGRPMDTSEYHTGRYGGDEVQKLNLAAFVMRYGENHVANLPTRTAEGRLAMDSYAPPGSEGKMVFAVARLESSVHPIRLNADLFGEDLASLLILPVRVSSEGARFEIRPFDWIVVVRGLAGNMQFSQENLRGAVAVEMVVNAALPLVYQGSYQGSPTDATVSLVYSTNWRFGAQQPTYLQVEIPEEDVQVRRGTAFQLEWAVFNRSQNRWDTVTKRLEAGAEQIPSYWSPALQGIEVRGSLRLEKKSGGGQAPWLNGNLSLPRLTLRGEKG